MPNGCSNTVTLSAQMLAVTKQLDTMFTTTQQLASVLKDKPNPHRTAYVRLIAELEGCLLNVYGQTNAQTREVIDRHLATRVEAMQDMVTKMNEV